MSSYLWFYFATIFFLIKCSYLQDQIKHVKITRHPAKNCVTWTNLFFMCKRAQRTKQGSYQTSSSSSAPSSSTSGAKSGPRSSSSSWEADTSSSSRAKGPRGLPEPWFKRQPVEEVKQAQLRSAWPREVASRSTSGYKPSPAPSSNTASCCMSSTQPHYPRPPLATCDWSK